MTTRQRSVFRWLSYVCFACGFLGIALTILPIGILLFGAANQRANGFGLLVETFGGGSPTSCSALRFVQLAGCNEHEGVGAHARIRTGDLFLTKWSSVPGEFDLILEPNPIFRRDHLTQPT